MSRLARPPPIPDAALLPIDYDVRLGRAGGAWGNVDRVRPRQPPVGRNPVKHMQAFGTIDSLRVFGVEDVQPACRIKDQL
jgi:hypothetical protein